MVKQHRPSSYLPLASVHVLSLTLLLSACGRSCGSSSTPSSSAHTSVAQASALLAERGTFEGFCEASAILPWQGGYVVADNEADDRLFGFDKAMAPRELSFALDVDDAEALVDYQGRLLVIGSHSLNKSGKRKPRRDRVQLQGAAPVLVDFSACKECQAGQTLNVEGAVFWQGSLWLGLRAPLLPASGPSKFAQLLRMQGDPSSGLAVAEVLAVDLGGRGVRDLAIDGDRLLLIAGPAEDRNEPHALYALASPGAAAEKLDVQLPPSAEGIAPASGGGFIVVIDGDGKPGKPCASPASWQKLRL